MTRDHLCFLLKSVCAVLDNDAREGTGEGEDSQVENKARDGLECRMEGRVEGVEWRIWE